MFNFIVLLLTFLSCLAGSWVCAQITHGKISIWYGLLSGLINTSLWIFILKYSRINLIGLSAWFDAVTAFGYFVGFIILGQPVTFIQIVGMILLILGLVLINY